MKVIFVTTYDARDVRNWSGIPYYLGKAFIDAGIEVHFIDNMKSLPDNYFQFRIRNLVYNKLLKGKFGKYERFYEPKNLKFIASQVKKKIEKIEDGIIFSPGTIPVAYLDTDKAITVWSDATFAVMENYYEEYKHLSKRTIRDCNMYEKNALSRTSLAVYSSEWAAKSSIEDYKIDATKVKVIPFGPNICPNRTIDDIKKINLKRSKTICKLLFIGQNWERKGGEAALKVTKYLNEHNIRTELTIVGCVPPEIVVLPEYVHVLGFINKYETEGENLINRLYSENHFFILPTIAECTPIVFSEANSFGLPIITTDTGGISSIIKNDVNGRMFNVDIDVSLCAQYIAGIFKDYAQYEKYSLTSFNEYLTRLNWEISVQKFISHLQCLQKAN